MTRALPFLLFFIVTASFADEALLRYPAVSATQIAFIYDAQLWVAPRTGGAATRLTDSPGRKFDPRFSPDGTRIAFSHAAAAGSVNIFTIAATGVATERVTWLPSHQVLCQWTNDDRLLFYTNALSFSRIEMQLFTVPARGGLPEKLPVPFGANASLDRDGRRLAYTTVWPNTLIEHWKRYRGGMAPDINVLDLRTKRTTKITSWSGSDQRPMWSGSTLYYVSDAGAEQRLNLRAYDFAKKERRQLTHFRDYDVRFASLGGNAIVFQYGAELRLFDLANGKTSTLHITVPPTELQREVDASRFITSLQLSPDGAELLLEARGDLWLAGGGKPPRNLTSTSGAFEREARRSSDGRSIAFFSDATGEYQLYVIDANGGTPRQLTHFKNGFRFRPAWSPDSKQLAFTDERGAIFLCDVATGALKEIDRDPMAQQPELAWSSDSTWLAYTRSSANRLGAIWRYDLATHEKQRITSDDYNASTPVFDPRGDHLFFISWRDFNNSVYDYLQQRIAYRGVTVIVAVDLRELPRDATWRDYEQHGKRLATATGAITALAATHDGDPVYAITDGAGVSSVRLFALHENRERVLAEKNTDFDVADGGGKLLLVRDGKYVVRDFAENATETTIDTTSMTTSIDLRTEWRQLFDDTWRLYRDFFHAPIHPLSGWTAVRRKYAAVLALCTSRDEVNDTIAEMIGETSVGHAYIANEGDAGTAPPAKPTGMLGADFALERGAFRITRIYEGAPVDDSARSPLRAAGVREGDYLLAVNGAPLDVTRDPRAAFAGLATTNVTITVGPNPQRDALARDVVVTPLADEFNLRHRAWVEANRAEVDRRSQGRIGYLHIDTFSTNGYGEFVRQFTGQIEKEALIIDTRWSQGGWIGGLLAELLDRQPLNFAPDRYSERPWPVPRQGAHFGPKALLVNHITVSAGENFAYYFRKQTLGPIIGARTWGGLTGLNPVPSLIDGGYVNVPNAPFFDRGEWLIEGRGLEPDVVVEDAGQLEAAVKSMLRALATSPRVPVSAPAR
jgi:tricorn protease